jgi:hypothetical protein
MYINTEEVVANAITKIEAGSLPATRPDENIIERNDEVLTKFFETAYPTMIGQSN